MRGFSGYKYVTQSVDHVHTGRPVQLDQDLSAFDAFSRLNENPVDPAADLRPDVGRKTGMNEPVGLDRLLNRAHRYIGGRFPSDFVPGAFLLHLLPGEIAATDEEYHEQSGQKLILH